MVDQIARLDLTHSLLLYLELLQAFLQLDVVGWAAGHPDNVFAEVAEVLFEDLGAVALRVEWDKNDFEFKVGALWQISDDPVHRRDVVESIGTHIGAAGVAEIDQVVISR